jgi:hypothetical protein
VETIQDKKESDDQYSTQATEVDVEDGEEWTPTSDTHTEAGTETGTIDRRKALVGLAAGTLAAGVYYSG